MKTDGTGAAHPFYRWPSVPVSTRPARMVRVRAIGPRRFSIRGRVVAEGETVDVDEYVAADLVALGKAKYAA